jgi:signal transduction histidine kinase
MTNWVKRDPALYLINAFFAAFVAVSSLDPIRSLVSVVYQKIFLQEASRINQLTRDAGKEIAGAFHANAIAAATEKFLKNALDTGLISFYALDADGDRFRKVHDGTPEGKLPESLPASFPHFFSAKSWAPALTAELKRRARRETLPAKLAQIQLALESLESLHSTLAFPLVHHRSVLGFATVNLEDPPENWDESWGSLPLLAPYFEKAGEALHELEVYARLRERDRLATLGEMAAGLAHEIRNPLGAIKGAAQVLDPKPGDPQEPFLKIIVEEVNRLNSVVTQFLNYAKPFQGQAEWVDLRELTRNASEGFARRCAESGVDFGLFRPDSMPLVRCQPSLIRLVIINLLENAFRAVKSEKPGQNSPTISLRLAHTIRDDSVEVSLSVEDNGPGMRPETLDKVFIPFFTLSPQGTGLGLSICQKIAEAHSGRMEASSVYGTGTLMTLRFTAESKESSHG